MTTYSFVPNPSVDVLNPRGAVFLAPDGSDVSAPASDLGVLSAGADASVLLSPDALLLYCRTRLDSIDGQVRAAMGQQQKRISENSAIQSVLQTFQENSGGVTNDAASCKKMETSLQALVEQLKVSDPHCPELAKLEQTYNDLLYSGTGQSSPLLYEDGNLYPAKQNGPYGDNTLSNTEMQTFITNLQGCVSDLNSGSELQMIQLQSLMSQRQTAIQLTTNLVQSLGDQAQKIAENVGR